MSSSLDTSRISPTAHFTAFVWVKEGLSFPELATRRGRLLHAGLQPAQLALRAIGAATLDDTLVARHRVIDHLLGEAVATGQIGQVVEIAAGLSPRGLHLCRRFPALRYIEGDLPEMVAIKRALVERVGGGPEVVSLNALREGGEGSLESVVADLDPDRGTAIITEGLLNYFDLDTARSVWRRIAQALDRFPAGLYLSDAYLASEAALIPGTAIFRRMLSVFARGGVHFHFEDAAELTRALIDAGFAGARVHRAGDFAGRLGVAPPRRSAYVRVIEARTGSAAGT